MTVGKTYITLLVILAATFCASFINLGPGNEILAWAFGVMKAVVILFGFMHFRRELESSKIYFLVGLLTVLLLVVGMLDDVLFR
jgi:caa(3)-type oxidase subunit IV